MAKNDTPKPAALATRPVGSTLPTDFDPALAAVLQSGTGFEGMKHEDFALPFVQILQGLSPQVTPGKPNFLKDARPGMLCNTVTNELFSGEDGVPVIPVAFGKAWIEWKPRASGGGFVKAHASPEAAARDRIPPIGDPKQDTQIIETANWYVLMQSADGTFSQAVFSWSSTKLKESRRWASLSAQQKVNGKQLAMFGQAYIIKTVSKQNDKGTFFVPQVELFKRTYDIDVNLIHEAVDFAALINSGTAKVDFAATAEVVDDEDAPEAGGPKF